MQQVEADRDTAGNYIVRRVLDYAKLPLAAERTAAQRMEPALRGYRDFANLPTAQETEVMVVWLILFRASRVVPPVNAASPATATTW